MCPMRSGRPDPAAAGANLSVRMHEIATSTTADATLAQSATHTPCDRIRSCIHMSRTCVISRIPSSSPNATAPTDSPMKTCVPCSRQRGPRAATARSGTRPGRSGRTVSSQRETLPLYRSPSPSSARVVRLSVWM
jgi:hypothetical protein